MGVPLWQEIGRVGGVFALAFVACLIGVPVVGLALARLLYPHSVDCLAYCVYFPAFALWDGSLLIGPWEGRRWVSEDSGYRTIPLAVWMVTWAGFAWAARRLSARWQFGAAVGVVLVVTAGMHLALAALGIRLVYDVL